MEKCEKYNVMKNEKIMGNKHRVTITHINIMRTIVFFRIVDKHDSYMMGRSSV